MINYGSGREVFNYSNDKVVKVPRNENGIMQNKKEFEIYNKYKDYNFGKFLSPCELVEINGEDCIVMQKVNCWTYEEIENLEYLWDLSNLAYKFNEDYSLIEEMIETLNNNEGLVLEDMTIAMDNWGEKDGQLYIIDYGWTYEMAKKF